MNYIQDLSDLEWIKELDREFVVGLDVQETHTTVWGVFLTTIDELRAKLDSRNMGFGCIDVNLAVVGFDWHAVDQLNDNVLKALERAPYAYRYIIDTVARN